MLVMLCCRFVLHVPENLPLDAAAPLLCAGITTYSPLMHYDLNKAGMKLGVVGLGGLGHMAVKIAKAMGLEVHAAPVPVHPLLLFGHLVWCLQHNCVHTTPPKQLFGIETRQS